MTPADAARILAIAAAYDRRTVGELDARAWADALDDLDPRDCAEAVRAHYRDSTAWCMPAHIRAIVKARRHEAAARAQDRQTFGEIEAAARYDHDAAEQARREARQAFDQALAARPAAPVPVPAVGSAAPVENGVRA